MTTPYFQIALNRDLEQDTARREKAMKVLNVMLSEEAQNRIVAASEMTVAEIAYEVGFSSPSYFTKCYKEQFGESPTDFLKRKNL